MASIARSLPAANNPLAWLWQWLRDELTPYPGRLALVARMVISATLVMIIGMTFRIPYTWQGAVYALLVSRENPRATPLLRLILYSAHDVIVHRVPIAVNRMSCGRV